ncbi:MAG: hypothetical protein IH957_01180 [Chloroflexi bacterium]|nr:hypothetical protein [Chloroflexota bacterium]
MRPSKLTFLIASAIVAVVAVVTATTVGVDDGAASSEEAQPQTTVGVRFVHDGELVPIWLGQALGAPTADGIGCGILTAAIPIFTQAETFSWPLKALGVPHECSKGPPTILRFEWFAWGPADGTHLEVEFVWEGCDLIYDLEVPDFLVGAQSPAPWPTPNVTATPMVPVPCDTSTPTISAPSTIATPAELPNTGGGPDEGPVPLLLIGIALIGTTIVLAAWVLRPRP